MTVASKLASLVVAIGNCERTGNEEWAHRHAEAIGAIDLPSGSGFDAGTSFDVDANVALGGKRLRFDVSFHHMNEDGFYDGWTDHTVTVYPEFDGVRVVVGGRDRNDIKGYIGEVFHEAMTHVV